MPDLGFRPRIVLAHRIVGRILEMTGASVAVPPPGDVHAAVWLDDAAGEVQLVAAGPYARRLATVTLNPPDRPRTAFAEIHVLELADTAETRERPVLRADVVIAESLVADIFGEEAAP